MKKISIPPGSVIGKIEKNVPLPQNLKTRAVGLSQTLRQLEVGDSFLFDGAETSPHVLARRLGIKITMHKEGTGYRVWRVPLPSCNTSPPGVAPKPLSNPALQIIRNERAVFAVKIKKGRCFGIAFSTDVTDDEALAMARDAHAGEWRKIDTGSLRFL